MFHRSPPAVDLALIAVLVAGSALDASPASVQEVEVHHNGFTVTQSYEIDAEPASVYRAMVERVADYWHSDHTFSGDAANLYIEARPGGCFCERVEGGFVRHLDVLVAWPGRLLRLGGGLGPLGQYAVSGALSLGLEATDDGTTLVLTYRVSGHVPEGFDSWAEPVSGVLRQQMERLERLVETGTAEAGGA